MGSAHIEDLLGYAYYEVTQPLFTSLFFIYLYCRRTATPKDAGKIIATMIVTTIPRATKIPKKGEHSPIQQADQQQQARGTTRVEIST